MPACTVAATASHWGSQVANRECEVNVMLSLQSLILTDFTVHLPDWLFSFNALVILLIGVVIGILLGRARRR